MGADYSNYLDRLQQRKTELERAEKMQSDTKAARLTHALAPILELAQTLRNAEEISGFSTPTGDWREARCILEGPNRRWSITVCSRDARVSGKQQLDMLDELFDLPASASPDYLIAVRGTTGREKRFDYDERKMDYGPVLDYIIECIALAAKR